MDKAGYSSNQNQSTKSFSHSSLAWSQTVALLATTANYGKIWKNARLHLTHLHRITRSLQHLSSSYRLKNKLAHPQKYHPFHSLVIASILVLVNHGEFFFQGGCPAS